MGQSVVMVKIAAHADHGREVVIAELVEDGDSVGDRVIGLAPAVVFSDLVAERGDKQVEAQSAGLRAEVSVKHVHLESVFQVAVIDPDTFFFDASPIVGFVAHDAAGRLQPESETALEAVILRFTAVIFGATGGFHPHAQRQFEGVQPVVRIRDGAVRMVVEEEADAGVISGRNRVLRLHAQGYMGIGRGRYDHVPGILNRVVAILEHESHPEFAAVAQTETAQDQQGTVDIAVDAVDVAHARPVGRLDALQVVKLKADAHLRMLAGRRESGRTEVCPSQLQIIREERRSDVLSEERRIIPAVV